MPGVIIGDYGLEIPIRDKVHEIEFQDFNLLGFQLDPDTRNARIALEYDDTDPASIKVTFNLNSWVSMQIEKSDGKACFSGRRVVTHSDPSQVMNQTMEELLAIAEEHGNLEIIMRTASGTVRVVLQDAKWEADLDVSKLVD